LEIGELIKKQNFFLKTHLSIIKKKLKKKKKLYLFSSHALEEFVVSFCIFHFI